MKSFTEYLTESHRQYGFRVKIAGHELDKDMLDRVEQGLTAYDLADISKPKRLPIAHTNEFHKLGAVERHVFDIKTNYPANPPMIAQNIHNSTGIPLGNIMVIDPNSDNEGAIVHEPGEPLLSNTDLVDDVKNAQDQVGEKHVMSFLKSLETTKHEFAAKEKTDSKSTNDLPQGTTSPVGSNKNKLQGARGK
jgi:hypothetical protein